MKAGDKLRHQPDPRPHAPNTLGATPNHALRGKLEIILKTKFLKAAHAGAALVLSSLSAAAFAQYVVRPPVADSTGIKGGVIATMPKLPPASTITNIFKDPTASNGDTNIPPGYKEVATPMGNRDLGGDVAAATYYYALGYPVVQVAGSTFVTLSAASCGSYSGSGQVLYQPATNIDGGGAESGGGAMSTPDHWVVCEPQGTRYELQKIIGVSQLVVTQTMLDSITIAPAVGMSSQTATAVCQRWGYANYIPGSAMTTQAYDCGYSITRWNGTGFYNDNACYNPVLHQVTCYK